MMEKLRIILLAGAAVVSMYTPGTESENVERLVCNVESLEDHSFMQVSEFDEYVCVNLADSSDFVILVDEFSEYRIGDRLKVTLNIHGEVLLIHTELLNEGAN